MTPQAMPRFQHPNFLPVSDELEAPNLTIHGHLPEGLTGTLYRNGPNLRFPGEGHWFTGDGMIHAIRLDCGAAHYSNRWVRTPKFLAEAKAGRALYRGFAGKHPDAPPDTPDDRNAANTHVVWHANRLMALEEAHPPTAIDPDDLATLDRTIPGLPPGPFTAHPKIDPKTGEMLFFGYNAAGPFSPELSFGVLDRAGRMRQYTRFQAPYASMVHDFMVTEHFVLFPVLPLTGSMERAARGQPPYAWEPEKGAFIGVLRRDAPDAPIRWFQGDPCYIFHTVNAWEDGETLVAEVVAFAEPPLFPRADGMPGDPAKQRGHLTRWTFDLNGPDRFHQTQIDDLIAEFPRIDDRWAGRPQRHRWFACMRQRDSTGAFDGIAHIDGATGQRQIHWLRPGDGISEPVFAPDGPGEGEGWLLAVAYRAATGNSELLIFNARAIEAGPLASVELPHRVPFGFHGSWVPQEVRS